MLISGKRANQIWILPDVCIPWCQVFSILFFPSFFNRSRVFQPAPAVYTFCLLAMLHSNKFRPPWRTAKQSIPLLSYAITVPHHAARCIFVCKLPHSFRQLTFILFSMATGRKSCSPAGKQLAFRKTIKRSKERIWYEEQQPDQCPPGS